MKIQFLSDVTMLSAGKELMMSVRRIILPSSVSSRFLDCVTIKMEAVRWTVSSVTTIRSTYRDIPQDLNFKMHIII
jgi:hypothetical protein